MSRLDANLWLRPCAEPGVGHLQQGQAVVELRHECEEVDVQGVQPRPELDHIEAPHPAFNLADCCLVAAKPLRKVGLTQPLPLPAGSQQFQEFFVVPGVQGLEHGLPSPAR